MGGMAAGGCQVGGGDVDGMSSLRGGRGRALCTCAVGRLCAQQARCQANERTCAVGRGGRFTGDGAYMAVAEPADFVHIYDVAADFKREQVRRSRGAVRAQRCGEVKGVARAGVWRGQGCGEGRGGAGRGAAVWAVEP